MGADPVGTAARPDVGSPHARPPRHRLVTLALAGCGGATRVGAADPDAHVLTLMNPIGDTQEITIYAQEVARRSKGKLRIRIVRSPHQGKIGYEAAVIDDVRAGAATSRGPAAGRGRAACARSTRRC